MVRISPAIFFLIIFLIIIAADNVSLKVNAVVYFRVLDHNKAVVEIENYLYATSQLAQTTLRSVIAQSQFDELLSERDKINGELQDISDIQNSCKRRDNPSHILKNLLG